MISGKPRARALVIRDWHWDCMDRRVPAVVRDFYGILAGDGID